MYKLGVSTCTTEHPLRAVALCFVAGLHLWQAAFAESKKDWDDCVSSDSEVSITAVDHLGRGKETKDNLAIAYYNRGIAYQDKGDHAKAIAEFNQSIRLNASNPAAYRNRGYSHAQTGESTSPSTTTIRP